MTDSNYACQVVKLGKFTKLEGLDNLQAVDILGYQALVSPDTMQPGDLVLAFVAETQLSEAYASANNLHRDATLNRDKDATGYLEKNRRVRAIKLRGHHSNALVMPLVSLEWMGIHTHLVEGDRFESLKRNDRKGETVEICRKYVSPAAKKAMQSGDKRVRDAFKKIDARMFPEHYSTAQYRRVDRNYRDGVEIVLTQKLHGTSVRFGKVPVLRDLGRWERVLRKLGAKVQTHEYKLVVGSRHVIKGEVNGPEEQKNHYYSKDIWTEVAEALGQDLPNGVMVYGEIIGWVGESPIQANFTYDVPKGHWDFYAYRVTTINAEGFQIDLSHDAAQEFCAKRGIKFVPEILRTNTDDIPHDLDALNEVALAEWNHAAVPLSDKKMADEGLCIRQEALVPLISKQKNASFLAHETRLLDKDVVDLEEVS